MCASLKKNAHICFAHLISFYPPTCVQIICALVCVACVACAATWLSRNCVIHLFYINGVYLVFTYAYHDYKGTHCMWRQKCLPRGEIRMAFATVQLNSMSLLVLYTFYRCKLLFWKKYFSKTPLKLFENYYYLVLLYDFLQGMSFSPNSER